jgi:excinuclease ABC subunit C
LAEREEFELAQNYKLQLATLEKLKLRKVAAFAKDVDIDVFAYVDNGAYSAVSIIIIRGGKMLGSENYALTDASLDASQALVGFLTQYYDGNIMLPKEVLCSHFIEESERELLKEFLYSKYSERVDFVFPKKGAKKNMVDMALKNARDFLENSIDKINYNRLLTEGAVEQLREYLGLKSLPDRIECFDISNISGVDKVASMVVFFKGASKREHYRKFKIRTVEGIDDFASMKEVVSRRLSRLKDEQEKDASFSSKPDLIIVDGGKGQLSSAISARDGLELFDIDFIGLAKREEEVFVPLNSEPIVLQKNSFALKLLQRIRDEAHRFAITFHRTKRANTMFSSFLDKIDGIGEKKKKAIIDRFKSLEAIKAASVEELKSVKNISAKNALDIYNKIRGE